MTPMQRPGKPLTAAQRQVEIDKICGGFVAPGGSNRAIYKALLERLLPPGAGIPGPVVTRDELRQAVEALKPGYKDVFRRVRELQGEEGLHGLEKDGTRYQLQQLAVADKREPRRAVDHALARSVALDQGSRCAVCGEPVATNGERVDVDHRVPRLRGGDSRRANLQVLCTSCNNAKSTQCSNCTLECKTCGWAFPEKYRPVKLRPDIILQLKRRASDTNQDVDRIANALLEKALAARGRRG